MYHRSHYKSAEQKEQHAASVMMFNYLPVHDTFSMCVAAKFSKLKYNIHHSQKLLKSKHANIL